MDGRVGAVVALKPFARAKSRITGVQPTLRHQLARSMALDTLAALREGGTQVLVISDQPDLADILTRSGLPGIRVLAEAPTEDGHRGLNHALTQGDRVLRSAGFDTVLACVADLPALRPEHVRRVVQAHLATSVRTFLGDADGVGTTMLLATGVDLDPLFQGNSAGRHRESGALALTDTVLGAPIPGARRDVDDLASLAGAVENGVGPHTRALLERDGDLPRSPA
ncbi:MAG: 2-phospho-L-lactate guanylyltransferase [Propionibacteriaceae bacterium]